MYKGARLMIVDRNAILLARVPSGGPILLTWCRAMNRHYLEYSRRQSVILSRYSWHIAGSHLPRLMTRFK
jgi:hypothetical protein